MAFTSEFSYVQGGIGIVEVEEGSELCVELNLDELKFWASCQGSIET